MHTHLKPLAALLPLAFVSDLHAQQLLDLVVVTSTRFESEQQQQPIAAQVITAEEIRESSATTVSEVLSKLGNVQTRISFTGVPDTPIDLRGFGMTGDQNTLVLVNGQRISEFENATARLSAIPLDSIERIEILRGSGAVLYGSGASGGTINVITRSSIAAPLFGNLSAQIGSHDSRDLRSGMQVGGENWGLRLNAQHYENDNYRKNNRVKQDAINGELRLGNQKDFIAIGFNADNQKARLPGPRTEAELWSDRRGTRTPDDYVNSKNQMVFLRGEKNLGDVTLGLDIGHRDKQGDMYNQSTWGSSRMKTDVKTTTVSPRVLWKSKFGNVDNQLTAGIDWSEWSYHNDTAGTGWLSSLDEHGKQKNRAIYIRDEMRFPTGTRLSLGARRESVEQSHRERLVPNPESSTKQYLNAHEIALQQELGRDFSAYGRMGRSFRVANIDENRCWFAPCPAPLKPQTSQDREVGVQWSGKRASMRAGLFQMNVDNEIHYNVLTYSNMNLSPTRHRGLELEGKVFLGDSVDVAARYTRTQAKFREGVYGGVNVTGNEVPMVPKDRIGLNIGWQATNDTRATFNVIYTGKQRYDNDQANLFRRMPGYVVADLKVSHQMGPWRFAAGINNLFDKKYYSYGIVNGAYTSFNAYPEDRRNAYISAEYRF